jgi:hypothetical protein
MRAVKIAGRFLNVSQSSRPITSQEAATTARVYKENATENIKMSGANKTRARTKRIDRGLHFEIRINSVEGLSW